MIKRIAAERQQLQPGRWLAVAVVAVLYAIGYAAGVVAKVTALTVTWPVAAVRIGWKDARVKKGRR